ncbi:MAG: DMT family transporter [Chloroflexota bacterium]
MTPAEGSAGVRLFADRRAAEIAVLAVMAVWAANFIVVKDVISILPPVAFTFTRYTLASIALLAILRWTEGAIRLPSPGAFRILLLGGLGFGVYQMLWTVGLVSIAAGDSALLIAASPVFTAVIAVLIGTDTLDPRKAVGVVLSFSGVALVIGAGVGFEFSGAPIGFAMTLAAAVCWAVYTAVGARVMRRHSPLVLTTWATIGGTLVLAPVGIGQLLAPGAIGPDQVERLPSIVFAVIYSGVFAAALANVIVFNGVRMLGPTRISAVQSLVPALAVVLAFFVLGEAIRPGQVLGGVIIVTGVALTRYASRRTAARSSTRVT